MSKTDSSVVVDKSNLGPLLLTIGPQLCGKSTYIHALGSKCLEVSLEDIPGLWESVFIDDALHVWQHKNVTGSVALQTKDKFGVTLAERLTALEESEHMLLALLCNGKINLAEFKKRMAHHFDEENLHTFIECVTEILAWPVTFTSTHVDIMITEAVAESRVAAINKLRWAMMNEPELIAWGNTNLAPSYYKDVLQMAAGCQRAVRFIRWGQELACVSIHDLMKRNILKYLKTGRYIEVKKLLVFYKAAEAIKNASHDTMTQVDFANKAGFCMDERGVIYEMADGKCTLINHTHVNGVAIHNRPVVKSSTAVKVVISESSGGNVVHQQAAQSESTVSTSEIVEGSFQGEEEEEAFVPKVRESAVAVNATTNATASATGETVVKNELSTLRSVAEELSSANTSSETVTETVITTITTTTTEKVSSEKKVEASSVAESTQSSSTSSNVNVSTSASSSSTASTESATVAATETATAASEGTSDKVTVASTETASTVSVSTPEPNTTVVTVKDTDGFSTASLSLNAEGTRIETTGLSVHGDGEHRGEIAAEHTVVTPHSAQSSNVWSKWSNTGVVTSLGSISHDEHAENYHASRAHFNGFDASNQSTSAASFTTSSFSSSTTSSSSHMFSSHSSSSSSSSSSTHSTSFYSSSNSDSSAHSSHSAADIAKAKEAAKQAEAARFRADAERHAEIERRRKEAQAQADRDAAAAELALKEKERADRERAERAAVNAAEVQRLAAVFTAQAAQAEQDRLAAVEAQRIKDAGAAAQAEKDRLASEKAADAAALETQRARDAQAAEEARLAAENAARLSRDQASSESAPTGSVSQSGTVDLTEGDDDNIAAKSRPHSTTEGANNHGKEVQWPHGPQYPAIPPGEKEVVYLRHTGNLDPVTGTVLYTHLKVEADEIRQHTHDAKLLPVVTLKKVPSNIDLCEPTTPLTPAHDEPQLPKVLLRKLSDLDLVPGEEEHAHLENA